jgi:4-nitrophenyl phosphatase
LTVGPFDLANFTRDPDVAAVVCGLDMHVTYTKYAKVPAPSPLSAHAPAHTPRQAFQYLKYNPDCAFIATNVDSTYPAAGGGLLPGAGAVSAPLATALGRAPLAIGKPAKTMLDCIRAKCVARSRCAGGADARAGSTSTRPARSWSATG